MLEKIPLPSQEAMQAAFTKVNGKPKSNSEIRNNFISQNLLNQLKKASKDFEKLDNNKQIDPSKSSNIDLTNKKNIGDTK